MEQQPKDTRLHTLTMQTVLTYIKFGTLLSSYPSHSLAHTCALAQDCNLVLYDGNAPSKGASAATAVYYSATFGNGAKPCSLVVSSAAGGFFAVVDSTGATVFQRPQPTPPPSSTTPPPTSAASINGSLPAGQSLAQVGPRTA